MRLSLLIPLLISLSARASLNEAKSFMGQLIELSKLSRESQGKAGDEASQKIHRLSDKIDFQAMAKRSLPKWSAYPESERKDFLQTLQSLLEVVVFPNAKKLAASPDDVKYTESAGNKVTALGRVEKEKNGDLVSQDVEVTLIFDPKSDKIVDAVIEGEVFSANLKRQFTEALKKQKFAAIIQKMKKRVNDARK